MSGERTIVIISDALRAPAPSHAGDLHDATSHHRHYGSSACNGSERIVESRRGSRRHFINPRGL
jgi:hypothetical protein